MNFKSSLITLLAIFGTLSLFSKNIYLRYDAACMDRLEYRLNGNMAGNGLISYSLKASDSERIVLEIGVESIKQVKRAPKGTKACGKVKVDDLLANSINSGKDKVYIVRKVGKNYLVSPVHLATYIKDSPKNFSMRGNQFDMSYASSDIGVMENNLAGRNSTTKVYFIGSEQQICSDAYVIKKIPLETCKPYTDMTFMPGIGVIEEKTGVNQADAESNILRLVKINNTPLAEYMDNICNGGRAELAVKYEPVVEESVVLQPATTNKPAAAAPRNQPAKGAIIFPVAYEAPAPEYRPAGSDLLYEYEEPQRAAAAFRPKGVDCTNLSYQGVHIVQTNQTLYSIARQYNLTVKQLRDWNKLGNKDLINPCQSLYVLPPNTVVDNTSTFNSNGQRQGSSGLSSNTGTDNTPALNSNGQRQGSGGLPSNSGAGNTPTGDLAEKGAAIIYKNTAPENMPTPAAATVAKKTAKPANALSQKAAKPTETCDKLGYEGVHIVQKGETLYSIAKANNLTVDQIQKWNKLGKKNQIKPCTSLYTKTPETVIAAINNPSKDTPSDKSYTIPSDEMGASYTNAPSGNNKVLANTQPAAGTSVNTPKGGASKVVNNTTGKMWNSGIEYHVVQKGETLTSLAKTYGFTLDRFKDINGLGDSNNIRIGQVLRTGNCLCPADGVGPTSSNTYNGANNVNVTNEIEPSGLGSGSFDDASVISNGGGNAGSANDSMTEKGGSATTERSTEYVPVPVPYDYETESVLNNTKRGDNTISRRNGRKVHTVQENETMATIANKYNLPIALLRKLNKMEKNEIVIPDMKIYLE